MCVCVCVCVLYFGCEPVCVLLAATDYIEVCVCVVSYQGSASFCQPMECAFFIILFTMAGGNRVCVAKGT